MPRTDTPPALLTLNAASSSVRVVLCQAGNRLERNLHSQVDRIGLGGSCRAVRDTAKRQPCLRRMPSSDHQAAILRVGVRTMRKNQELMITHAENGAASPMKPPAQE